MSLNTGTWNVSSNVSSCLYQMNHQNIESLAPCEGKQPTTDEFPQKEPVMTNDLHRDFILSLTHTITHSFSIYCWTSINWMFVQQFV